MKYLITISLLFGIAKAQYKAIAPIEDTTLALNGYTVFIKANIAQKVVDTQDSLMGSLKGITRSGYTYWIPQYTIIEILDKKQNEVSIVGNGTIYIPTGFK